MGRNVVGRRARRRRHQGAVADQFFHALDAVDLDPELRRLTGLADQRHLVDGQGLVLSALGVGGGHRQRADLRRLGFFKALQKAVFLVGVHQEPDRAPVHAVDRLAALHGGMQALEHEAVAAQGDDHVGVFDGHGVVAPR